MSKLRQVVLVGACLMTLAACSSTNTGEKGGWFSSDNLLRYTAPEVKGEPVISNGAVLRIKPFVDERGQKSPRFLGDKTTRVRGMDGNVLVMDRDLSDIATEVYKRKFSKAGYEVLADDATKAPVFELSGVLKRLTLNSKDRDDVDVAIQANLTEVASGKLIWSALVTEKNDRFAGVSGNNKESVVAYLNQGVGIVAGKTVSAVDSLLMASYPALFNLTPGTKAINGVTVYTAPIITPTVAPIAAAPVAVVAPVAVAAPVVAATYTGTLALSSKPSRAKVYIDGVYFGLSPMKIEMDAGVHEVEVKLDGYKAASEKVSVRKANTTELEFALKR